MAEKDGLIGLLSLIVVGIVILYFLSYFAEVFFFSYLATSLFGVLVLGAGFVAVVLTILYGVGACGSSSRGCPRKSRITTGTLCILLLLGVAVASWQTSQLDPIANSPEVIEVTEGDVFYSGLKGYPIAKTALSTFLPGSIADFMNGLLPSQYHWTVFRFEVPNYVNYYGYAEGDFEGENFYRIYVGKIDTYNYITFMEISRIEEINVFEASAYVLGHALPFGNVIYRILSIAFLIPALFLAIGAILSFAGRREEEPEWEAKVKPREEAPETIAQQTSMAGEQATAPKQVEMAQLRMEIEELETRYDLGDISLDEYEKKRDSLTAALRTRQGELLRKRELLNTKKEELEVRWLIEEVSKEDYDRRTKVIKTEMERIRNELDSIEKWLRQMGPKSL